MTMNKYFVIMLLGIVLSACTKVVPTDREVETMVRASVLSDGFGDLFALENFERTNGFRESDNVYIVDVEYDLVFRKSFVEVVREGGADPTGPQYGLFGSKLLLAAIQSNFGQFEVGDRIHKQQKIRLHKTEKGWRIAG